MRLTETSSQSHCTQGMRSLALKSKQVACFCLRCMSHASDKVRILKCQGYKVLVTVSEDPPKNRNDHSWGLESSQDSSLTLELLSEPRVSHGHTNNLIPSCNRGPQRKRVNTFLVPPANIGILRNCLGDYNSW